MGPMDDPTVRFAISVVAAVALIWHKANGSREATATLHRAVEYLQTEFDAAATRVREETP